MQTKIKKTIKVFCVQHPNGDAWITADTILMGHFKILSMKEIPVEFEVDLGYDERRAYPKGRIS